MIIPVENYMYIPDEDYQPDQPLPRGEEAREIRHRLTVNMQIYHQTNGGNAQDVHPKFSRELQNDEQMYQRNGKIGNEAKKLDIGWIADGSLPVGYVVLEHLERGGQFLPIEVMFLGSEAGIIILPGEHAAFTPVHIERICIKTAGPTVKYRITAIPG